MFELGSMAPNYGAFFGGLRNLFVLKASALFAPWQITPTGATLVLTPEHWIPIELDYDKWELSQATVEEKGGKLVESAVTGSFVNPTLGLISATQALELHGVVVVCEDNEGQRWILGNKGQPVRTLSKYNSNTGRIAPQMLAISMTCKSRFGAVPYSFDLAQSYVAPGGGGNGGSSAGSGTPA